MGKNAQKSQKSRKPGQHAPKQGVGETYDWVVNDMAVINMRTQSTFPANNEYDQMTMTIACDANGYNYNSYSANNAVDNSFPTSSLPGFGQQQPYGISNDQFTRLSMLWQEYRVNSISMCVVPTGPGGPLQAAANYTCVDESGQFNRLEKRTSQTETALIPEMASQKSLKIHSPYTTTNRNFSLNKWLIQTQDTAWLPTQDKEYTALQRVPYATPVNQALAPVGGLDKAGLTPGLFSMLKFNITYDSPWTGVGANVLFKTHFVFRSRRLLDPLSDMVIFRQMDGIHIDKLDSYCQAHQIKNNPSEAQQRSKETEALALPSDGTSHESKSTVTEKSKSKCLEDELTRSQMVKFITNLK